MTTIKDALLHTTPGIPYKFFDTATISDITEKVVFNLNKYGNMKVIKAVMTNNKIYYYI